MNCWICGNTANSGEHRMKASDLRDHFGQMSQNKPLYLHLDERRNIPIRSAKNDRLKFNVQICARCNNQRTQPYDFAWEHVSKYVRANWTTLKREKIIDFSRIFPTYTKRSLIDAHLYFVKLLGCMIVEHDIPINVKSFSNSIIHRRPHKNIFIGFGCVKSLHDTKIAVVSPVKAVDIDNSSVFASFLYIFNEFAVNVIYNEVPGNNAVLQNTWHPNKNFKSVKLKKLKT